MTNENLPSWYDDEHIAWLARHERRRRRRMWLGIVGIGLSLVGIGVSVATLLSVLLTTHP